jgi:glutamate--cysteine ligase
MSNQESKNKAYEDKLYKEIFDYLIKPFTHKKNKHTGVEFEFALVNLKTPKVNPGIAQGVMFALIKERDFAVAENDFNNNPIDVVNKHGDHVCFSGTINVLELSLVANQNLQEMYLRFHSIFDFIQEFLLSNNHILSGLGLHPYYNLIDIKPIDNSYDNGYFNNSYDTPLFWATSATQVHLDVNIDELVDVLNLLSSLSFISAKLFSNSVYLSGPNVVSQKSICHRDEIYQIFGDVANTDNVGGYTRSFRDLDDLIMNIEDRLLFRVFRKNKGYIFFKPTSVKDYFRTKKIFGRVFTKKRITEECSFIPSFTDLKFIKSYKIIEPRVFGTLETRGDCAQPVTSIFAPAAFYTGILQNWRKTAKIIANLQRLNPIAWRKRIINKQLPPNMNDKHFSQLITQVLVVAEEGLRARKLGEEKFLYPLYQRAETLKSPAEANLDLLRKGTSLTNIIKFNAGIS